jgi:phage repressor protein C with HTH and peptisase S24 domain
MVPTLFDADVVLMKPLATPQPGDVVIVVWAARPGQLSVKRALRPDGDGWFVAGDNSFGSTDSRELGPASVVGVVTWRLWPRPRRFR